MLLQYHLGDDKIVFSRFAAFRWQSPRELLAARDCTELCSGSCTFRTAEPALCYVILTRMLL